MCGALLLAGCTVRTSIQAIPTANAEPVPATTAPKLAASAQPVAKPAEEPSSFTTEKTLPCRADTPEHAEATAAYDALDTLISGLPHDADPKVANAAIAGLLALPCFEVAYVDTNSELVADSGLALTTWWGRGGSAWVDHYLKLWNVDDDRWWWSFVDMPKTLTLDVHPDHALAHWLCPHDDKVCGTETRGWLVRAQTHFELYAKSRQVNRGASWSASCEEQAAAKPEVDRYDAWVECENAAEAKHQALPLGAFKTPKDGWLVVRGRRGHHGFCDEIRIFGLKAGSMFTARSCSRLALRNGGSVDQGKTNASRKVVTEASRVPLSNLREAALMILLSNEAQDAGTWNGWGRDIPKGLVAKRGMGGLGMSGMGSSGHTTLRWTYLRKGKVVAGGELQYPDNLSNAVKDHAMRLLRLAEASSVEGCAPERLAALPFAIAKTPGVSALDADPRSLADANAVLVSALVDLRKSAKRCR
jgi:hypothetical protein